MVAGGVLAAALLAVIAGGAVVSLTEDRMPSGPGIAPADAAPATALIDYDPQSGLVSVEELSYTVPGEPFSCDAVAEEAPAGVSQLALLLRLRARELRLQRPRLGQHGKPGRVG